MKQFTRKALVAAAPVVAVSVSIGLLQAAHLPFPPPLTADAWPQWAVFCLVVHSAILLCKFAVNRLFDESEPPGPEALPPAA